jgi:predicted nucleotidyltransferase component of viral defense system
MNILANKITAFNDREEAKDISDIWIISKILEW